MDKEKLENICQIQTELSKLEINWEGLQKEKSSSKGWKTQIIIV